MNDYNWLIDLQHDPEAFRERYDALSDREKDVIDEVLAEAKANGLQTQART